MTLYGNNKLELLKIKKTPLVKKSKLDLVNVEINKNTLILKNQCKPHQMGQDFQLRGAKLHISIGNSIFQGSLLPVQLCST